MSKKNRMRVCPAAGRTIEAYECGAGRHITFACPEHCPFNAFSASNYDQFVGLEHSGDEKFFQWLIDHVPNKLQFEAGLQTRIGDAPNNPYFHYLAWHGIYRTDSNGETCLGKWAKSGFPGLNSDERILMRRR